MIIPMYQTSQDHKGLVHTLIDYIICNKIIFLEIYLPRRKCLNTLYHSLALLYKIRLDD